MNRIVVAFTAVSLTAVLVGPANGQEPTAPKGLPFSSARRAGNTLYVSGQLPRTPEGTEVRASVDAETRQVMDNIGRILKEQGYSFDDVVSATVYLASLQDYKEMNQAYASYFPNAFPTRACVGGVEIVFGYRVEISCIAYKE